MPHTTPAPLAGSPEKQVYRDGGLTEPSSIGPQIRTDYYKKKALIEAAKEQYFGQLADVTDMPKHFGKTIKMYHYLPLLSDQNVNDQGIDTTGEIVTPGIKVTYRFTAPGAATTGGPEGPDYYLLGEGADEPTAHTNAQAQANSESFFVNITGNVNIWADGGSSYGNVIAYLQGLGWLITDENEQDHNTGVSVGVPATGNLYGSSKDVGTIAGKMPVLSENGGRVNRVGFKRIELEGTIQKFGFFDEYTQESLDFDTDAELEMHVNREMIMGANEITEDLLQIDLLNSAGVLRFGGSATATIEITGDTGSESLITYEDLQKMAIDLDDNRTPKHTKIIAGSRMIDTKVIDSARVLYVGTEVQRQLKKMKDDFDNQAFIPVQAYADAGNLLRGEIGTIDQFRIVVVPEMMHWAGAGAPVTPGDNAGYRETGGNYDVFPMLCVGSESFTTVGFQTDGKTVKFVIMNKKPGMETAHHADPYGEIGFMSIKWYYGFMLKRPERIALAKTVGEW
jgi:N4-gp56 family major capsid protein